MSICGALCRRKEVDESSVAQSSLLRVLNTFDLTALGVGSTLGVGIYVLAGEVSKSVAGPAVVISFLLAAITSVFAGLCYAEFGARVPKAGSAYIYSYYTVGEVVAFVIGWCLILEYVIGSASVARGISTYIDSLLSESIKKFFLELAPMDAPYLAPYVDFFAFGLCIVLAAALAFGVRESTIINNVLTFCNLSVVAFVIISGLFEVDFKNWQLEKSKVPPDAGEGGFAPFGVLGIVKGAAICFYGFVGFDCIATTGEEVKNPQRAIPLSILISLLIIFLAYFGVSSVLTLMWPYFDQDPDAPLPYVYGKIGWEFAKWLVSIGALFGMFSSLFGAMFPLPRIIYAMASDGLIFRVLGEVSPRTKTPVVGTAVAGLVTATMAALFNLQQLISLMALGTLLAYTIVAISVIILRYSPDFDDNYKEIGECTGLVSHCDCSGVKGFLLNYFRCSSGRPTALTKKIVVFNVAVFGIVSLIVSKLIACVNDDGTDATSIGFLSFFAVVLLIVFVSMCIQPKAGKSLPFQMPLVPLLPCLSIFLNIYLMAVLDRTTWIKLLIWLGSGIIPYIFWYIWKYRHGQLGENSRYNVNRVNNIKLNELVWTLARNNKSFMDGYVNEAFVGDLEPQKSETEKPAPSPGLKNNSIFNEIHVYDESAVTTQFSEINNNVYVEEKEPEGEEKWRSVAEVHVAPEEERVVEETRTETVIVETSADKFDAWREEDAIFGPHIPIRKRTMMNPRGKVEDVKGMVMGQETTPEKFKFKRGSRFVTNEMKEKLSKILQEQASFIRSGAERPTVNTLRNTTDYPSGQGSHTDIKTLSKAEVMNRLQQLLKNGPPKRPYFRRPALGEETKK
ncbi:UNVERIFIED_CONTAM: hypothetical protein PYX00_010139 [Menopon gallinae]